MPTEGSKSSRTETRKFQRKGLFFSRRKKTVVGGESVSSSGGEDISLGPNQLVCPENVWCPGGRGHGAMGEGSGMYDGTTIDNGTSEPRVTGSLYDCSYD